MTAPTAVIALATIPSAQSAIVARLCRLFGRAVTNKLIEGVLPGSELVIAGPDLAELEAITDSAQTRCWNPEFTYANDLARKGPLAQGATIAQLILAFVPLGLKGRYQVRLPYPEWLMLETNRFPLRRAHDHRHHRWRHRGHLRRRCLLFQAYRRSMARYGVRQSNGRARCK